jgi:hypothetical protein
LTGLQIKLLSSDKQIICKIFITSFLIFSIAIAVYIIWYGTWAASEKNIIQTFVSTLGSTAWWGINKAYGVGTLTFKTGIDDATYSQGKNLTKPWTVVQNAFDNKLLPEDTNGIYLVLSSR